MFLASPPAFVVALSMIPTIASAAAPQDRAAPASAPKTAPAIPDGADRAVRAALAAAPGSALESVETPSHPLGLGGPECNLWTIHVRAGGVKQTFNVSSDGVAIRSTKPVETKDLPTLVGNAVAKLAPAGAAKITKLETRGVVRYVALPEPVIRYTARLEGEGGALSTTVSPDGKILDSRVAKEHKPPAVPKNPRKQDGPIPEPAARAVKAMREVFPTMVFDLVEEVPYVDSTTETMTMVWYEVEFYLDGEKKEFTATPDGIVISFTKKIDAADLPKAAADALLKPMVDGKIAELLKSETRAAARFVALDMPVVVYEVEIAAVAEAPAHSVKLRADGTKVEAPALPDWAKGPAKKETKDTKDAKDTKPTKDKAK